MKILLLIIFFYSINSFAHRETWPLDYDPNLPVLFDPQKPHIDPVAEENFILEEMSKQVIENSPPEEFESSNPEETEENP
jgi:hypothetical protein